MAARARRPAADTLALIGAGFLVLSLMARWLELLRGPDDRDRDSIPSDPPAPLDLRRLDPERRRTDAPSVNGAEPVPAETRKAA